MKSQTDQTDQTDQSNTVHLTLISELLTCDLGQADNAGKVLALL